MYPWTNYTPPTQRARPPRETPKQALLKSILQTPVYLQNPDELQIIEPSSSHSAVESTHPTPRLYPQNSDDLQIIEPPSSSAAVRHPRKKLMADFTPAVPETGVEGRVHPYHPSYAAQYSEQHHHLNPHMQHPYHPGWSHHPTQVEEEVMIYNSYPEQPGHMTRQPSHMTETTLIVGGQDFTLNQKNPATIAPGTSSAQTSKQGSITYSAKPTHTAAKTQAPRIPIPGSTLDALAVFEQKPKPKPVEPRTDDRLLVSSILNSEPTAPEEANKKKSKKRGRKRKKNSAANVSNQGKIGKSGQRIPMNMMSTPMVNPGQRVPMNMMAHPMDSMIQMQYPNIPDDIDGAEISDMSVSGDEQESEPEILQIPPREPSSSGSKLLPRPSTDLIEIQEKPARYSPPTIAIHKKKFIVNLISAANADQFYPAKTGEIYETGSSLYKCVERPFFGTVFDKVLQYVPLPDYSKADVAEEDRTRINTGHRYTVWLDKSDTDYLCLRKLNRSGETNKMLSSYRGFSPGHGILRLHVRDAFIPAHCPLANPSTMTYLQRALPNCPPPDLEISVKNTEPSNILIAAMIHRPSPNSQQKGNVDCSMVLFPHYIDSYYGEPNFPETLHFPQLRKLFKIVQFNFRGDLDIFKICNTTNGVEAVHLLPKNQKNIEVISLL